MMAGQAMPRILFLGENWYGSSARACCYALRRLGCDVLDIDIQTFIPQLRRRSSRAALRLLKGRLVREYNQRILHAAADFRPDVLLAFKAPNVLPETLQALRSAGISLYNYFPDRMAMARNTLLEQSIPEYDCIFDTKTSWDGDTAEHIKTRCSVFVPHGYDPELHKPADLDTRDLQELACDVSVVATQLPMKEKLLEELLSLRPKLDLRIWGSQWDEYCRSNLVKKFVRGWTVTGTRYAKILSAARINLGLMGVTPEIKDETTTRTYEIPACGGFMLHERAPEVLRLYQEGKEMAAYGSVDELAQKIDYYLAHPDERQAIAQAGHQRCVPAYSYDNRMLEILRWHNKVRGRS